MAADSAQNRASWRSATASARRKQASASAGRRSAIRASPGQAVELGLHPALRRALDPGQRIAERAACRVDRAGGEVCLGQSRQMVGHEDGAAGRLVSRDPVMERGDAGGGGAGRRQGPAAIHLGLGQPVGVVVALRHHQQGRRLLLRGAVLAGPFGAARRRRPARRRTCADAPALAPRPGPRGSPRRRAAASPSMKSVQARYIALDHPRIVGVDAAELAMLRGIVERQRVHQLAPGLAELAEHEEVGASTRCAVRRCARSLLPSASRTISSEMARDCGSSARQK